MGIRPLYGRVVVLVTEKNDRTEGGLYIPESTKDKERPSKGLVIEVGEGRLLPDGKIVPLKVKPNDTIFFNKYAGTPVPDMPADKRIVIMSEDDILAIIE